MLCVLGGVPVWPMWRASRLPSSRCRTPAPYPVSAPICRASPGQPQYALVPSGLIAMPGRWGWRTLYCRSADGTWPAAPRAGRAGSVAPSLRLLFAELHRDTATRPSPHHPRLTAATICRRSGRRRDAFLLGATLVEHAYTDATIDPVQGPGGPMARSTKDTRAENKSHAICGPHVPAGDGDSV